jgi:dienelactone hydrolase
MRWAREGSYAVGRAAVKGRRARGTDVRLFLPPGRHPDASLPCVFVCPAGSNLLIGVPFGDDEHVDFLPLLDRGLAVCFYTLDGTVTDPSNVPELVLALAMQQYAASEGGLHNLSDAIDTALAGSKAIDPQRLGVCGHSSAGTIAVMAVGREPRVAAGAVMAPAIDLPKRFGEEVLDALPGESVRLAHSGSPSSLERIDRPLLIVHARDDENAPAGEAQAFAAKHPGNVTLRLIDSGGHAGAYHEGLVPSFDFLAKALRAE